MFTNRMQLAMPYIHRHQLSTSSSAVAEKQGCRECQFWPKYKQQSSALATSVIAEHWIGHTHYRAGVFN